MAVILRRRKNSDGSTSQLLDIYHKGARKYEFLTELKIVVIKNPVDRLNNKKKKDLAEQIRNKRETELAASDYDLSVKSKGNVDFIAFYADYCKNYSKKDKRVVQGSLTMFMEFMKLEGLKSLTAKQLTEELATDYKSYLQENLNGESPANYFKKFKMVLKHGVKKGLFLVSPAQDLKATRHESIKKEILTWDEVKKLAATPCTNDELKRAFLFSCTTGLRFCDVANLHWKNIHGKVMKITQQKTLKEVVVNLNDDAIGFIGNRGKETDFIFNLPSHTACLKGLGVWCQKAGITKHITWHCARHTFGTSIIEFGGDVSSASSLLGHSSFTYTQQYVRIVEKRKEQAVQNLPSMSGK